MWTTMLLLGGWIGFWGFLFWFVRWVTLERAFFAGQDPERWQPASHPEAVPAVVERPTPLEALSHVAVSGRPA